MVFKVATLIVAVLALGVSAFSIYSTIHHAKKSILPICKIDISNYEDKIGLSILNCGIGPMIIDNVVFEKNNTRYKSIFEIINDIGTFNDFVTEFEGRAIRPEDSLAIFLIEDGFLTDTIKSSIRSKLKDVTVMVDYHDIYNKKMKTEVRKLSFFGTIG